MKNNVKTYILFLITSGVVLVMFNVIVWLGTKNGQLTPIENLPLWGAFVLLNVCSLLWAVSLLGLQPLVVAFSYVAGGVLAFQGVRFLPEVNIAEVTTAGATYSAFGVLVAGNITTKVRLAFFQKGQVPFVLVILSLLMLDGLLNSRVLNASWSVILHALIFPFVFSGIIIGLIWMVLTQLSIGQGLARPSVDTVADEPSVDQELVEEQADYDSKFMFKVPDAVIADGDQEETVAAMEEEESIVDPEPETPTVYEEEILSSADFFPLEIDKNDDFVLPQENSNLMDIASMISEEAAELAPDFPEVMEEKIRADYVVTSKGKVEGSPESTESKEEVDSIALLSKHSKLLKKLNQKNEGESHG